MLAHNPHVPGSRKRKSDFQTEDEWRAYKAELKARTDVRWAKQRAAEEAEGKLGYEEWCTERVQAGAELLAAWSNLYAAVIVTTNVDLVRLVNRLHRTTATVIDYLLDEKSADYWPDEWIQENPDPLQALPELFEESHRGPGR